jgi:ankyrin repeat protein
MFERELPARPNLAQYKKQAKELAHACAEHELEALSRLKRNHPRFHKLSEPALRAATSSLTDAQLVLAREHGFESWPKFAGHIETLQLIQAVANLTDPVAAFIEVATVPRHTNHNSGTLEHAELILARYPQVARASLYTAVLLADEAAVRSMVAGDAGAAARKGGPLGWDPLTYLCFSRYLRLDKERSPAFTRTAKILLDAGAPAQSGWTEMIDQPTPRPILESTIYGAAAIAQHVELTKLLLDCGADPNDEETPYHVPETYDNTVLKIMLESGKFNARSLGWLLARKADWHDQDGLRMVLAHGADANLQLRWGGNAFHHAVRRDNQIGTLTMLLDSGGDPAILSTLGSLSVTAIAARRGRGDFLQLLEERNLPLGLEGVDRLIAACAMGDRDAIAAMTAQEPDLVAQLIAAGGSLLAEFAGNNNVEGVRCLLDLGVPPNALYIHGDGYFGIALNSTALHSAAWHGWPEVVRELLARGTAVNAIDGWGRSALALAVKACVDSYWKNRRVPDSVAALLEAGATVEGIEFPTGYDAIDVLLRAYFE